LPRFDEKRCSSFELEAFENVTPSGIGCTTTRPRSHQPDPAWLPGSATGGFLVGFIVEFGSETMLSRFFPDAAVIERSTQNISDTNQ